MIQEQLPIEVQILFKHLYALDPVLAEEVGRLPEFQTKVSERQVLALKRFVNLIQNTTAEEKTNLEKLLKVGKPEVRSYCVPLQSVFWTLETDDYKPDASPLAYDLETLLYLAWDFSEEERWKSFKVVRDRLNAPELIDFYERRQFTYSRGHRYDMSPQEVFAGKTGHCEGVTAFTVYCLRRSGYRARSHRVQSPTGHPRGHTVTLFEWNGDKYIMDNGRPHGRGMVPFDVYSPF
jgi:hypothetical protein